MNQLTNRHELNKLYRILDRVNGYADEMAALSDEELQAKTPEFKARIERGASLDSLLPEVFAVCREAAKRVLGMYPYDVQVLGGIVLHQGKIAEMKTGEGKTLVATMPLYLNALSGKSCILVTMNSYLAVRDCAEMSVLYRWLGLSCACGTTDNEKEKISDARKKKIYQADIVYSTNVALGFDYLLENLKTSTAQKYLRPFNYIIIDEADSVLLDSAIRPLIISGSPKVQSTLYETADYFVTTLTKDVDYQTEEKAVWLTESGIRKAEVFYGEPHLFTSVHFDLVRHIQLALRAHAVYERDRQYVVEDNCVYLLDGETGRVLPNTKLRSGQHQALEAKEHVPLTQDSRTMASITYQDFFNMFPKKAGMTGTGATDEAEFRSNYQLQVVQIPTRKPIARKDYPDRYFTTADAQISHAMEEIMAVHATGQPVLVITDSIGMSDVFSRLLLARRIPHSVLNAYNTAKEAEMIKAAGQRNAVTVATAVAGRGTDIKLGEGVRELGGLAVLGISRMENQRYEMQARGRAGRQGDPGFSRFYVSLEDQVVKDYGAESLQNKTKYSREFHTLWLRQAVQDAQANCEEQNRQSRRTTAEFGRSMLVQRNIVYATRNKIMERSETDPSWYLKIERQNIEDWLNQFGSPKKRRKRRSTGALLGEYSEDLFGGYEEMREDAGEPSPAEDENDPSAWNSAGDDELDGRETERLGETRTYALAGTRRKRGASRRGSGLPDRGDVIRYILDHIAYRVRREPTDMDLNSRTHIENYLMECALEELERKNEQLKTDKARQQYYRGMVLHAVDEAWIDEVDYLQQLRTVLEGRQYAQRNVEYEYHIEAGKAFDQMQRRIRIEMMHNVLQGQIIPLKDGTLRTMYP